jgi:hypothetical protein
MGSTEKYFVRVNLPPSKLLFASLIFKAMAHFIFGRFKFCFVAGEGGPFQGSPRMEVV